MHHAAGATTSSAAAAGYAAESQTITTKSIPPGQRVRGDGDADNPGDIDGGGDRDGPATGGPDSDRDQPVPSSYRLPDPDDRQLLAYGQAPKAAERRAIDTVVLRYFAAAAAADGSSACPLLEPELARTTPEDNAGLRDPAYVRGAKTCPQVLTRLFAHYHEELAAPIVVFTVRVRGAEARAFVASPTLRAGRLFLVRRGRAWRLMQLLSEPLP